MSESEHQHQARQSRGEAMVNSINSAAFPFPSTTRSESFTMPVTTSPTSLVLTTAELLEKILRQLEPDEQVVAHQVCKTWQNMVNTSIHIFPRAFPWIKPVQTSEYLVWELKDDMVRRQVKVNTLYLPRLHLEHSASAIRIGRLHPVLRNITHKDFKTATDIEINVDKILAWKSDFWRTQLLTQPPIPLRALHLGSAACRSSSGLTLGDLYDALKVYRTDRSEFDGEDLGPIMRGTLRFLVPDSQFVIEARRFKEEEDAKAKVSDMRARANIEAEQAVAMARSKAEENRKVKEAFEAVTKDNWFAGAEEH